MSTCGERGGCGDEAFGHGQVAVYAHGGVGFCGLTLAALGHGEEQRV